MKRNKRLILSIAIMSALGMMSGVTYAAASGGTSCPPAAVGNMNDCGSMGNVASNSVQIAFTAAQESQLSTYQIDFTGKSGRTWTYQVTPIKGKALSHWSLGMVNCEGHLASTSPIATQIGADGSTGFNGVKWDTTGGTFSFTLDGDYSTGALTAMAKTATVFKTGAINGPDCSKPATPVLTAQTISFGALATKTSTDAPFTVSATASSGLPVSVSATGNCTVSGSTVTLTGAGSCTVTATQAGNTSYSPATSVSQTFTINAPPAPTSGTVGGYGGFTSWGQCQSTMSGGTTLSVVGRLLPTAGKSLVDYNDGSVTGEVYNNDSVPHTVTLVSYKEFYPDTNFDDKTVNGLLIPGQRVNNYQTVSVPAGGHVNLTAQLPGCSTQIDLVCADVIQYLGNNNLYGSRKLAYYHAHQPNNQWCDSTGVTPWNPATNSFSTNPPAACTLKMDSVTGVTAGQAVEPGTTLNLLGNTSGGTPKQVKFDISGPNGVVASSPWTDTASPYSVSWNTTGLPEGQYTATASVYDANGVSTSTACDAKTVNFTLARACPFNMTTLTNVPTSVVAAGTVLNVGANVTGGTPSKVQFDVMDASGNVIQTVQGSTASINTSNYVDGQYTVKVSVFGTSAAACQTQQASFSVKKPCQFNMAGLTGVTNGSTVQAGASLAIGATVTGTPTQVSFAVTGPNGAAVTSYDDTAAPYGLASNLDTTSLAEGQYTVTAKAYDQFNVGTSNACQTQSLAFSVVKPCKFNMAGITGVTNGSTVKAGTALTLGATAANGTPTKVNVAVTGPTGAAIANAVGSVAIDTTNLAEGQYTVSATGFDGTLACPAPASAAFSVVKPCKFNMTGITGVTSGALVKAGTALTLGATAANGTPTKVSLAVTGPTGAAVANADNSVALDTTNLAEGQYTVNATGFDGTTACPTSTSATFSVAKPCPFNMTGLSGVTDGSTVKTGTSLTIGANVTGTPTKVKFDVTGPNGTAITSYEASAAPYGLPSVDTSSASEGQYVVKATAYDTFNTACQVKTATVTLQKLCKFNMTGITGVTNGDTVKAGTALTLGGTAANGTPTKVSLAVTGPTGAAVTNADSSVALDTTNLAEGQYTVKATGFDGTTACPTPASAAFSVVKPCKFNMTGITGVTNGDTVKAGAALTLGGTAANGTPSKVNVAVTGPTGVAVTNADGKVAVDTTNLAEGQYTVKATGFDDATACPTPASATFNVVKPCKFNMTGITGIANGDTVKAGAALTISGTAANGTPTKLSVAVTDANNAAVASAEFHPNVSEAIELLEGVKVPAIEYMAARGRFPTTIYELTDKTSGRYTASLTSNPEQFYFEATMNGEDSVLAGKTVRLVYNPNTKTWSYSVDQPNGVPQLPMFLDTTNLAEGQYTVKATGFDDATACPAPASATFNVVKPCKFNMTGITGVTNGATVKAGTALTLGGTAANGTPTKVRIAVIDANNAAVAGAYNSVVLDTTNLAEGQYTVKARGFDGTTACPAPASATFNVVKPCKFNMTGITGVANGDTVKAGAALTLGGTAANGTPSKVNVAVTGPNGAAVANADGNVAVDTTNLAEGQYTVKATGFDDATACPTPASATFNVVKPCKFNMTGITGVTNGDTVKAGTALTLGGTAANGTPSKVNVAVTGPTGVAVTNADGNVALDTTNLEGLYTVKATGFDDATACPTPASATFTVEKPCKFKMDNLTGVTDGQTVNWGDTLALGANVTDGIPAKVKFELTGPEGVINSSDNASAPYSALDTLDTSKSGAGAYTLKVSAYDRFGATTNAACATKQVSFNVVKSPWATSFTGGVYPNDFCSLSKAMAASGNLSAMALPQWVEVPAWIETYDAVNQTPQGGLKVKVSNVWSVAHPSTTVEAEKDAAAAVVCPDEMSSDTCNAGQVLKGEDQELTSDASGKIDFTVKVWWPGIVPNYLELLAAHQDDETLIKDYTVQSAYKVMVSGGHTGEEAIKDRDSTTGQTEFDGNISWNPTMVKVDVLKAGSEKVLSFDGCVLTGVDLETR